MSQARQLVEAVLATAKVAQRDRALAPIERRLKRKMVEAFAAHRRAFMQEFAEIGPALLQEAAAAQPLPQIEGALTAAYQSSLEQFTGPIEEAAAASIEAAARHRVAEFQVGFQFNLENPRAVKVIKARGARAVSEIDETTRSEISRIVTRGMEEGQSYQQVAREIVKKYDSFGDPIRGAKHIRNRAELIAINEAGEAYEEGNRMVIDEMAEIGLEMEKFWSDVGDEKVSAGCRRNAAAGWISKDQAFPSGDQFSPRFPGCRCAILYRRKPSPEEA